MTQLVEGDSTVVKMRAPEIQTGIQGRSPDSRKLPKCSTKRDLANFDHMEQVRSLKKENLSAPVK